MTPISASTTRCGRRSTSSTSRSPPKAFRRQPCHRDPPRHERQSAELLRLVRATRLEASNRLESQRESDGLPPQAIPVLFFSREEARIHVHVSCPEGEAKFWLKPVIALADHYGLTAKTLREIQTIEHCDEIVAAWKKHFSL